MKVGEYKDFVFYLPLSGGKAGFGHNKTGSIQVRKGGQIIKQFRFKMGDPESRHQAIQKAKSFVWRQ